MFSLDGNIFFNNNGINEEGGGLELYVNNRIQCEIIGYLSINIDNCLEFMTVILLLWQML